MAKKRRADSDPVKQLTVLFDFGGVLAKAHNPIPTLHRQTGGDPQAVAEAFWGHRLEYDKGELTLEEYWTRVLAAAGIQDPSEDELLDMQELDNRYFGTLAPHSRELIHDLARNGVRLAILSNANAHFGEYVRTQEWFEAFQFGIFSAEEKTVKPERRIFDIALDVIAHETGGVARPRNVIFFDDSKENVEAARALGIDAHHWPRNGQAAQPDQANPEDQADQPDRADQIGQPELMPEAAPDPSARPGWQIAREVLAARGVPLG